MARPREDLAARCDLDDPPEIHHADPGAHVSHDAQVVCDEEHGQVQPLPQVEEQVHDLRLDGYVHGRHRLIRDDEDRIDRERPGNPDPLALPTAEVAGKSVGMARVQADELEQRSDPFPDLGAWADRMDRQGLGQHLAHRHPRVQGRVRVLEDHLNVPTSPQQPISVEAEDILAPEEDLAGGRLDQPQDRAPEGGLSGAGFSDEAEDLAPPDLEGDVVDRHDFRRGGAAEMAQQAAPRRERHAQVAHVDKRDVDGGGMGVHGGHDADCPGATAKPAASPPAPA